MPFCEANPKNASSDDETCLFVCPLCMPRKRRRGKMSGKFEIWFPIGCQGGRRSHEREVKVKVTRYFKTENKVALSVSSSEITWRNVEDLIKDIWRITKQKFQEVPGTDGNQK